MRALGFYAVLALCFPFLLFAEEVPTETRVECIDNKIETIHKILTSYDLYWTWDDHVYDEYKIKGQSLVLIDMTESDPGIGFDPDNALVSIKLRPLGLGKTKADGLFYPRLMLHCLTTWNGSKEFTQKCEKADSFKSPKDPSKTIRDPGFGLIVFKVTVSAKENQTGCTGVQVVTKIELLPNAEDVKKLFNRIASGPGAFVASLFKNQQEQFYRYYFLRFYKQLILNLNDKTAPKKP